MIKGVIFDLDGVILDTEYFNVKFKHQKARELGYDLTIKDIKGSLGLGISESDNYFYQLTNTRTLYPILSHFRREKTKQYIEVHGVPFRPDVLYTLKALKEKGIKTSLATSCPKILLDYYFTKSDFSKYFDQIVTGDEVKKGKPMPDIFLKALNKLELPCEDVIVVEDSLNGLKGAKRANIKTVFIKDQYCCKKDDFAYIDYSFKTIKGILNLL